MHRSTSRFSAATRTPSWLVNTTAAFVGDGTAESSGTMASARTCSDRGCARYTGGLSVLTFIRVRTWIRMDDLSDASDVLSDTVALAWQEAEVARSGLASGDSDDDDRCC